MEFAIYNTLTRKKEMFVPITKGKIKLYGCGPTVYNKVHIGNLRAMLFYDVFRRFLTYAGYDVDFVMNITDVDDKTIRDSIKEGKSLKEFTEFYTEKFFEDSTKLNILKPTIISKATEHITDMINLIKKLKENGHTYEKNGSVYYRISSFKDYGKLANLNLDKLKENADGRLNNSDEYEKENARDFALWKAYNLDDKDVFWDTEFGKGRPGWHIECSAMSMKYLGETFDFHIGGVDLIFPHHTNEIAQSEGATGKKFVNYWVHNEHLMVNGKKMSKSLGNFYTLQDLLDKGYSQKAIRWLFISTHYRQQLNFTEESLKSAESTIKRLEEFMFALKEYVSAESDDSVEELLIKTKKEFDAGMCDDLEISRSLAALFDLVRIINPMLKDKKLSLDSVKKIFGLVKEFDKILGVLEVKEESLDSEIDELIATREEARKNKDWALSDKIRDDLKEKGIQLLDTPDGVKWRKN